MLIVGSRSQTLDHEHGQLKSIFLARIPSLTYGEPPPDQTDTQSAKKGPGLEKAKATASAPKKLLNPSTAMTHFPTLPPPLPPPRQASEAVAQGSVPSQDRNAPSPDTVLSGHATGDAHRSSHGGAVVDSSGYSHGASDESIGATSGLDVNIPAQLPPLPFNTRLPTIPEELGTSTCASEPEVQLPNVVMLSNNQTPPFPDLPGNIRSDSHPENDTLVPSNGNLTSKRIDVRSNDRTTNRLANRPGDGSSNPLIDRLSSSANNRIASQSVPHSQGAVDFSSHADPNVRGIASTAVVTSGENPFHETYGLKTANGMYTITDPLSNPAPCAQPEDMAMDDGDESPADSDLDVTDDEGGEGEEENALGRISDANRLVLKAELHEVHKRLRKVAKKTGLSTSQVFNHWTLATQRKSSKSNAWNLYGKYFKAHEKQELAHLREPIPSDAADVNIRQLCYKAFMADVHPAGPNILKTYSMAEALKGGSMSQSYVERKAEFHRVKDRLTDIMKQSESLHGFSGVFAIVGNVPNSDSGLGVVYETNHAKEFFLTRCRADKDAVLTHLKAHVYNNSSHTLVDLTFDEPLMTARARRGVADIQAAKATGVTHVLAKSGGQADSVAGPSKRAAEEVDQRSSLDSDEEPDDQRRLGISIASKLLHQLNGLAIPNAGVWKNIPWKTFGKKAVQHKFIARNWPEGVPLPPIHEIGQRRTQLQGSDEGEAKKRIVRSIQALPHGQLRLLWSAIYDEKNPLHFARYGGRSSELGKSLDPIVWGAPPRHTSKDRFGRRLFADGRVDRNGVPRLRPPSDNVEKGTESASDSDHSLPEDSAVHKKSSYRRKPISIPSLPTKKTPNAAASEYIDICDESDSDSDSDSDPPAPPKRKSDPAPRSTSRSKLESQRPQKAGTKRKRESLKDSQPSTKGKGKEKAHSPEGKDFLHGSSMVGESKRPRLHPPGYQDPSAVSRPDNFSNTPPCAYTGARPDGFSNFGATGGSNVQPDGFSTVGAAGRSNVQPNGLPDIRPDNFSRVEAIGHLNVRRDGFSDAQQDGFANIRPDGFPNVRPDGFANVRPDGFANVRPDGFANVRPDGFTNVRPDGFLGVRQDGFLDVQANGFPTVRPDSWPDTGMGPRSDVGAGYLF
ncbi:hypothetical protein GSI_04784 [Ganoderma sinense ZZ0214-1]|uniref:Uncharacterized protein n=1 Tax=Ganoderma sinense ZZ0214-1 TaxID=1077348 RepID=A0A2G8SHU6_9APHY|nr:hypothetical protein GSI_04784 [Ganoderma sinense ZZ0214-1]